MKLTELAQLKHEIDSLWNQACKFEKIPVDSKFVCFSDSNPFVIKYNRKMKEYGEEINRRIQANYENGVNMG